MTAVEHPGFVLRRLLETKAGDPRDREIAEALGIDRPRVTTLLNGRLSITPATARRLESAFGHIFEMNALDWLHLQMEYDLEMERQKPMPKVVRFIPSLPRGHQGALELKR